MQRSVRATQASLRKLYCTYLIHIRQYGRVPSPSFPPVPRPSFGRTSDGYKNFNRPPPRRRKTARYIGIGLGVLGGGYYMSHLERAPYTGRLRMIDISRSQEMVLGNQAFVALTSTGHVLPASHPHTQRVERVGKRIALQVKRMNPHLLKGFKWRFVVLEDPSSANAACAPGGKVVVFSGMLDLARDDDELAAVLAHEIAHAVLRHSAERLSFAKILIIVQFLLAAVFDVGALSSVLIHIISDLPYSRKLEREADYVGVRLMTDACYDPAASPRVFQSLARMQEKSGMQESRVTNMLSTHPMFKDRIKALNEEVPQQRERYRDQCGANDWGSWA